MSIRLKTILNKTNLNSIINSPTLEKDFLNFFKKKEIDKLTFEKLSLTITKKGKDISIKEYIHTLVDDLKALTHSFWEYYRLLTQQNNFVVLLTRDISKYKTDNENHNQYVELIKEKINMEKLNEVETLTLLHKTIDSDKTKEKEEKKKEKMKATVQMKKRINEKIQMMKKQLKDRKDELITIKRNLAKHQEDSRLNSEDIYKFYNDIIRQITTHMRKFVTKWDRYQSIRLMTSLKLHMPEYVLDKQSGLTVLSATPSLKKLQNIGLLLYEIENKIIFLEENNNAEQNAKELIEAEAKKEATEEAAEKKRRRRKREKKKRQISRKKEREKTAKTLQLKEAAAAAAPSSAQQSVPPPPSQPPVAVDESKREEDPFKVRIADIQSYLKELNINPKKEENTEFIKHEEVILEFIRELNKKMPSGYTLIITGGYAINLHGGNNKTSDVDMVLCHNDNVQTVRGIVTSQIFELMVEKKMKMSPKTNYVLQLAQGTDVNDPTNPVKIRINGVQAIDITFKDNTNNFCKKELKRGFFVLKKDFMKRNLIEITNDFREKLDEGIISHPGKLVSWLHQMTSLNKLLNPRSRTSSPTQGGVRKTRRRKKRKKRKKGRRKSRKKKK